MARKRARRRTVTGSLLVVVLLVAGAVLFLTRHLSTPHHPGCRVASGSASYALDLAQAANAATISAVAFRRQLDDHAVTVALATALQESKLHNVPYGDRDSLGLFQQRPSQGWGAPAQLLDPHFAAGAFFTHLARVPGWRTLPVADAAQAVQRSASGSAYARWERTARAIAQALTGEVPEGIACYYAGAGSSARGLTAALRADLGGGAIGSPVEAKAGWRSASWLVAQAAQYSIESVAFDGRRWTRASGRWSAHSSPAVVGYELSR